MQAEGEKLAEITRVLQANTEQLETTNNLVPTFSIYF